MNAAGSPFWEICVGDAVPTLQTINNCYNWYGSATAATALAMNTGSFTPTSLVNTNLPGTYEVWVEESNNFALTTPCRRRAFITVVPDAGNAQMLADNELCCDNETAVVVATGVNAPFPYTVGFWVAENPITDASGLMAADAAGRIFQADETLGLPAGQAGFEFTPNCTDLAPGDYFITPFTSYRNLPAPEFIVGPNANFTIPDNTSTGVSIPITVSQLPTDARLSQLCTFIQHEFTNDLVMTITAPSGAVINVVGTFSLTGAGTNIGTAATPACFVTSGGYNAGGCNGSAFPTPPCYTGSINSDSPLNIDVGNPNGVWTLNVFDIANSGFNGKVQFVELVFDQPAFAINFPTLGTVVEDCTFGAAIPIKVLPADCSTTPDEVNVRLKAYLEGAFNGSAMNTALNPFLPNEQPYNMAPWNYNGTESVADAPANAVDWVLVEARNPITFAVVDRAAGWLLSNGHVVDYADITKGVEFANLMDGGSYRFALRPRNHLPVLSEAFTVTTAAHTTVDYDFTTAQTQAAGKEQQKELTTGVFGLYAGDADGNAVITIFGDGNVIESQLGNTNQYKRADVNLDGTVDNTDFSTTRPNVGRIALMLFQ